jgi:hypothetical protein
MGENGEADMPDVSLIDAAKYGAAGIAVVGLIISGGLLKSALGQKEINQQSQTLIFAFMGLSALMVAALISLEIFRPQTDAKLETIRSSAAAIDVLLNMKVGYDSRIQNNPDLKANLKDALTQICKRVVEIGVEVGDTKVGANCTLGLQSL